MKTVYVNKEGVICACTVEVPEFHPHPCEYMPGIHDCPMCLGYDQALIECKEAVVPFEDSGKALMLLYRETKTDYKINASYGEWANNFLKEDTFYHIEADWEIVFATKEILDNGDFTIKKVARLKVSSPINNECPKCRSLTPENCHSMHCPVRKVSSPEDNKEQEQNRILWKRALEHSGSKMDPIKWLSDNFTITRKPLP